MRITSLELENIKSYSRTVIQFTPGVNAVCGLNGSGKTTILEAIGFALFDYLPYNQQAFLREGERNGTVRVRLQADDAREYEVVRKVGGAGYYVADVESGMRLAERSPNVLDWMRTHALGIDGDADLEALFKNAVGVPQGLMTADFQGTASTRKSIFDPLLRVEEYRDAYENLRETASYLRSLSSTVREDIARLEVDVEKIPDVGNQVEVLNRQLQECEERQNRLASQLVEVGEGLAVLEEINLQIQELNGKVRDSEYDVQRLGDRLATQRKDAEAARAARQAVEESKSGHQLVLAARDQLRKLEERRKERENLESQKSTAVADLRAVNGSIERLDAERRESLEAGDRAAALTAAVTLQDDLDGRLKESRIQLREIETLDAQIVKLRAEIQQLERSYTARESVLEQARVAQTDAGRLDEVIQAHQNVAARLAEMKPMREQLQMIEAEGKRWRQTLDKLGEDVAKSRDLEERIKQRRVVAESLDALSLRQQEVRDARTRALVEIDYQGVARNDLQRHHCPLLEVQCPVVSVDEGVLDRFATLVGSLDERVRALDAELASLERDLGAARSATIELQSLEVQVARLEHGETELAEAEAQVALYRGQYGELAQLLAEEGELQTTYRNLQREVQTVQAAAKLADRLPDLEQQHGSDRLRLDADRVEFKQAGLARAALKTVEDQVQALQKELAELGDPRTEQQRLLAVAARRAEIEKRLATEQERLTTEGDRLKALVGLLAPFQGLDEEIDEQRTIERDHAGDYDRFVANEDLAQQVEDRERDVEISVRALDEAHATERAVRRQLEETSARYNSELHEELAGRRQQLERDLAAEDQKRVHVERDLANREEELALLRRQEQKLLSRKDEWDELERAGRALAFIRDTIKAAGPAVTETLLANISQIANDVYCEIMDDHAVELRWDRDYEVLVQRGSETRGFAQLSGGEQMSAALAIRLSLLKEMSEVDIAFFDEPTQNMDGERRGNLADQIRQVRGFNQLIVISHDDTFEHHTDNLIRLEKIDDETHLEAG